MKVDHSSRALLNAGLSARARNDKVPSIEDDWVSDYFRVYSVKSC